MTFPGFDVMSRVAEGSTGIVWQARQVELGRVVAIKELSPALRHAPGFLERFRNEAQSLAALEDAHVVRIYDYVEEPDRAYLVQEWVEGAQLSAILQRHGRLTPEQSLGVLRGGLIGLAHAHSRGLVHRDISPANILVDRIGESKLVDFGLAAPADQGMAPGEATSVGTPAFCSPEAVTGRPMTARSDVYSVAAVLFMLLSGRLPFSGTVPRMLHAHMMSPAPVLDGHGPGLASLLARSMAKDPGERPADAAAFLAELETAATQRYGAGWLSRASVAGLVTAGAAAAGGAMVTGVAVASSPAAVPAVASALTYGSAASGGARLVGMSHTAVIAATTIVVAVVAAAAFVLIRPGLAVPAAASASSAAASAGAALGSGSADDPATGQDVGSEATPSPTPEPVAAFAGTYAVTITLTSKSGDVASWPEVGSVTTETWVVTGACSSGLCDASATSSAGASFSLAYAGGGWQQDTSFVAECIDSVTQVPNGETVNVAGARSLLPGGTVDEASALTGLTGTETLSVPEPGCGSGGVEISYTLALTRTGD